MKFLTYRSEDGRLRPGVLEGDLIRAIATPTLREYVELAPHERIAWHTADELVPLQSVALDAPIRPSRNVFCVGRNYLEHAKEGARAAGRELRLPERSDVFHQSSHGNRGSRSRLAPPSARLARVRF